jgi:zinc transport system substrate-binding protein
MYLMSRRVFPFFIILVMSVFMLAACDTDTPHNTDTIKVAVSIVPQKTFVEKVAGDLATVMVTVPPGSSPATYEPTPQEAATLSDADIYFAIGVPTEATNILPLIDPESTRLVTLQTHVSQVYPDIMVGENRDQHIWLSVKRVVVMVGVIADELSAIDPDNEQTYRDNAASYVTELETFIDEAEAKMSSLENRAFIVFHPAFRYFAEDFGLVMHALEQDGKEATPERIIEMIDFANEEGIKVIFYQAEFSSVQAQSFAEEIGGRTMLLAPLAPDYVDNMRRMVDLIADVLDDNDD